MKIEIPAIPQMQLQVGDGVIDLSRERKRIEVERENERLRARVLELEKTMAPNTLTVGRSDTTCYHRNVTVDRTLPRVSCTDCQADLDAITVLREYAIRERNFQTSLHHLGHEKARLEHEVEDLKRQRKNLRGQIGREAKRASKDGS